MAKKKVTKKKTSKKTARKSTSKKSPRASKKTTKKKPAKKTTKRKSTAQKKTAKKKVSKKKVVKKKSTKKSTKKTAKKTAAKSTKKKSSTKKSATKKTAKKATSTKPAAPSEKKQEPAKTEKPASKGNTGKKKRSSKAKKPEFKVPIRPLLLGPNGPAIKPLIPSGKDNKQVASVLDNVTSRRKKTPLTKTQLEKYRGILIRKREELLGDVHNLEEEALRSDSGRTSRTAQHLDEAGSESYEQSLNLNLAASDRERIIEIDAALQRIQDRTYGLCELTFEPISKERLNEIPWTRYTIEAARELDRRGGGR